MMVRDQLINIYLDWANNYVDIKTFAKHNGMLVEQGHALIGLARSVYNSQHPDK